MSDLTATIIFGRTHIWVKGKTREAAVIECDADGFPYSYKKCNIDDIVRWLKEELERRKK